MFNNQRHNVPIRNINVADTLCLKKQNTACCARTFTLWDKNGIYANCGTA